MQRYLCSFVAVGGGVCVCVAADGDVLGDRGDPSVHDRHAPRNPLPRLRHHEDLGRESQGIRSSPI